MPFILAIIFFVIFYFVSTVGEKASREGAMPPVLGSWLAFIVLSPTGLFLTSKAMKDSQLFSNEFYYRITRRIRKFGGEKIYDFLNRFFPPKNSES
jgi:lipopolysaccharide export system permease protein